MGQVAIFERAAWLRGEGGRRWQRALWRGRTGSRLLVCARPATPGEVGHEPDSAGGSRTMVA